MGGGWVGDSWLRIMPRCGSILQAETCQINLKTSEPMILKKLNIAINIEKVIFQQTNYIQIIFLTFPPTKPKKPNVKFVWGIPRPS